MAMKFVLCSVETKKASVAARAGWFGCLLEEIWCGKDVLFGAYLKESDQKLCQP